MNSHVDHDAFNQVPWLYPYTTNNNIKEDGSLFGRVKFTPEETSRLHAACKKHGMTVTQVITAICILSNAESALRLACNADEAFFSKTVSGFKSATHFHIKHNSVSGVSSGDF